MEVAALIGLCQSMYTLTKAIFELQVLVHKHKEESDKFCAYIKEIETRLRKGESTLAAHREKCLPETVYNELERNLQELEKHLESGRVLLEKLTTHTAWLRPTRACDRISKIKTSINDVMVKMVWDACFTNPQLNYQRPTPQAHPRPPLQVHQDQPPPPQAHRNPRPPPPVLHRPPPPQAYRQDPYPDWIKYRDSVQLHAQQGGNYRPEHHDPNVLQQAYRQESQSSSTLQPEYVQTHTLYPAAVHEWRRYAGDFTPGTSTC